MKTKYLFFSLFLIFFVLSFLTFPILMNIQTNHLQPLPNYPITTEHEEKKIALKIEDITSFHQIDSYNVISDDFSNDENLKNKSTTGTISFIFLNLDPNDERFEEKSKQLSSLLQRDNHWHLTLYLSPIFSSCIIYVNGIKAYSIGKMSAENDSNSSTHQSTTQPIFLDLSFNASKEALLNDDSLLKKEVTIQYESRQSNLSGIQGLILIGEDEAIREIIQRDIFFIYAVVLISILVLSLFIFVSILKKTLHYLPQIIGIIGIFLLSTSLYNLYDVTTNPFFLVAIFKSSFAILCFSGCMDLFQEKKNKKLKIIFMTTYGILFVINFLAGYFSDIPLIFIGEIVQFLVSLGIFAIAATRILCQSNHKNYWQIIFLPALMFSQLIRLNTLIYLSPFFYLAFFILIIITVLGMKEFILLERTNRYLMNNIQSEVKIQTKNLQTLIEEKDTLLRYVSHDMKKPIQGINHDLKLLKINLDDEQQMKAYHSITMRSSQIEKTLNELTKYEKNNFVIEKSKTLSIKKIIYTIYDNMKPDCDANGIELTISPVDFNIYGKENNLISILNNIVLNAIEHAECSKIEIKSFKNKEKGFIEIIDNGKGIDGHIDVFLPYYSISKTDENRGIGLYISKKFIQSMGGDITYKNENHHLIFTISLPLA